MKVVVNIPHLSPDKKIQLLMCCMSGCVEPAVCTVFVKSPARSHEAQGIKDG